ncbi:MAG: glucokinase [SAR324 cluster bacterium]|nr:glucokinase [SAR324 cluster bacterium]
MELILAGDIGGTNTRLALYEMGKLGEPLSMLVYPSGDYESLLAILQKFMDEAADTFKQGQLLRAGFGVAGPVDGNIVKLTNLPWVVDAQQIAARLNIGKATFVNDFSANCYAVTRLGPDDVHQIGGGEPVTGHPIAVLGAGTGLGEAFLVWAGTRYLVVPSEGGHTDFAPRNPLEVRLLEFLTERFGRVSYERVVSGPGLVNVYEFLREREGMEESPAVHEQMRQEDPGAVISRNGMDRSDALCDRALELFTSVYGAEAGNLALKLLARGGIYLAGGIAQKIIPRLEEGSFRYSFEQKGRYTNYLESVPTYVITHPQPGLMGAAVAADEA